MLIGLRRQSGDASCKLQIANCKSYRFWRFLGGLVRRQRWQQGRRIQQAMSATGKWDAPNELLRVVLGIPVGAVDLRQMHLHGHSRLSFAEQEVLDARRRHDALQYLKNDREAFHHAAGALIRLPFDINEEPNTFAIVEAAGFSPADDLRELEERVDSLKERVQRANVKAWVGRRVIERLRTSPVIGESFFGPDVDTVESSALREMVQERDALSVQLIKELQTLQRLQEELAVAEQEAQSTH